MIDARSALIAIVVAFGISVAIAAVTTIRRVNIAEPSVSQLITRS